MPRGLGPTRETPSPRDETKATAAVAMIGLTASEIVRLLVPVMLKTTME